MLVWQRVKHSQVIQGHVLARLRVQLGHVCEEVGLLHLIVEPLVLSKQTVLEDVPLPHRGQTGWRAVVDIVDVAQLLPKFQGSPGG